MENYCRLCAEQKGSNKLLQHTTQKFQDEIVEKLAFLNSVIANFFNQDSSLPTTVCIVCHESLNQTYDFISKVKKAQEILSDIFQNYDKHCSDTETFDDSEFVKDESKSKINEFIEIPLNTEVDEKEKIKVEYLNKQLQNDFKSVQDFLGLAQNETVDIYAQEVDSISLKTKYSWNNYNWICSLCGIEFMDLNTLRSHSKLVHYKCSTLLCADCKTFEKNVEFHKFISHVKKHRRSLRKCCHYCNTFFNKTTNLEEHLKMHLCNSRTTCSLCGEIFDTKEDLKQHILLYSSKSKRKPRRKKGVAITIEDLTCRLCSKVYKTPNSLRDHMKLHEKDRNRDYTCDRCGKAFYNKGTLTSHIMSHDKTRPHTCKICNKSFMFPNMLRRHVEMHSGIKPFSCELCGRCFRLQYQLKAHKIIHTDIMPFSCQYCNKSFRFKQILKNHELQHTGAKPYTCQECGMQFTNWSNYNKHMKRRHNMDTSKKKITPDGVFPVNPETGQLVQVVDESTEKWKSQIMVPGKRGKRKMH